MAKLDLVVQFKLMPEAVETDLMKVKEAVITTVKQIAPQAQLQGFETKPVAFGLKALMVTILTNDMMGGVDPLEDALGQIEGVQSAQVDQMGRI